VNGKWVVVTTEPSLVKKTVQSRPTQAVTDGLATREGMPYVNSTKLVMGAR
jgi:hypothetical protein